MFCNHCGGTLQAGQSFCASCGKPVAPGPVGAPVGAPVFAPRVAGRVAKHLSALAVLWIAVSAYRLIGAGGLFTVGRFMRRNIGWGHDPAHFLPAIFPAIGMVLFFTAIVGFACGWGLLQRKSWARVLALVLAALALLDPPFGTALGIYTLWVLLPSGSEQEYQAVAR